MRNFQQTIFNVDKMGAHLKTNGLQNVYFQERENSSGFKDAKELLSLFLRCRASEEFKVKSFLVHRYQRLN
jgi:hypothetical protein